ncbi:MAG: 50S ribosomal protein L25, partial [Pseudomonadota bacterium]
SNIPDTIEADLAGLDVNDVIRISNINLPDGASPTITDRDFMIANISAPSALASAENASEEEAEGEEEAAEAEGEEE